MSAISRSGAMSKVSFARSIRAAPIRPRPAGSTGGFDVEDHAIACVGQMVGGTGKIGRSAPVHCESGSDGKVASARPGSLASSSASRRALTARGASAGSMLSGCLSNLGLGLHDTGIGGEVLAAGQALCETVPRPGRSDQGAEPAAGKAEVNLPAGAAFGPFDALARLHDRRSPHEATGQQHADQLAGHPAEPWKGAMCCHMPAGSAHRSADLNMWSGGTCASIKVSQNRTPCSSGRGPSSPSTSSCRSQIASVGGPEGMPCSSPERARSCHAAAEPVMPSAVSAVRRCRPPGCR